MNNFDKAPALCKKYKDEIVKILEKEDKVIGKITETDWRIEFAMSLRRKLKEKGMSQRDLCFITGISPTTIHGYATAKRIPDAYNLTLIANALECSSSDLTCFV